MMSDGRRPDGTPELGLADVLAGLRPGCWAAATTGNPHTRHVVVVFKVSLEPQEARREAARLRALSGVNEVVAAELERAAHEALSQAGTA